MGQRSWLYRVKSSKSSLPLAVFIAVVASSVVVGTVAYQSPYTGPMRKNVMKPRLLLKPCARIGAHNVR